MFGYERAEITGEPLEILIPKRFRGRHPAHRTGYFNEPHVRPMGTGLELYGLRRDENEFPVEISLGPLQTEEGILVKPAIRDITERKGAEERIRHQNEMLSGLHCITLNLLRYREVNQPLGALLEISTTF